MHDAAESGTEHCHGGGTPEAVERAGTSETLAGNEAEKRRGDVDSEAFGASDDLADLRRRVAMLEAEHARLLGMSAGSVLPADFPREQFTPAYIGRALVAIEDHLADMERFAATGDEEAARQSKLAAAQRSCSTLRTLCDDEEFSEMLADMSSYANTAGISVPDQFSANSNDPGIEDKEVQLLRIAGLPEFMARAHVIAAVEAYRGDPTGALVRMQNPMMLLNDLRRLRDASCQTADILSQGIRQQRSRQRWKKILTFGVGGTLIVAVNGIGTAVLGPAGAAASGALGSAAVGVATQLL